MHPRKRCYCNLDKLLNEEIIAGEGLEAQSLISQSIIIVSDPP